MSIKHIAVVILNYNSELGLQVCAEQIVQQVGVRLSIILVDNASSQESVEVIRSWIAEWNSDAVCGTFTEIVAWVSENPEVSRETGCVYFIKNNENRGYSAGNNIGIRLAEMLNADAVLIANPDMRIEDPHYLKELSIQMFSDPLNLIAASRILGPDGSEQNPLRESSFLEEFLWPRSLLKRFSKRVTYILTCPLDSTTVVPKVSGCCLMLRTEFLRQTGYLDENVFLYCEEPILAAKVHALKGRVLYVPTVVAVHAHVPSKKDCSSKRMLIFIHSRRYYLKTYSGYGKFKLSLINLSYSFLKIYHWTRVRCNMS